jgi:hypothetical protein
MGYTTISTIAWHIKGHTMSKKTKKKVFARRIDQDGSYAHCRAKTWGADPRKGNNERNSVKTKLQQEKWDVEH